MSNRCIAWVKSVLADGLYPDLPDDKGITALMLTAVMHVHSGLGLILADAPIRVGADIDAQSETGMTALMFAKRASAANVDKLLLAAGAETNFRNAVGQKASEMPAVTGVRCALAQYGAAGTGNRVRRVAHHTPVAPRTMSATEGRMDSRIIKIS